MKLPQTALTSLKLATASRNIIFIILLAKPAIAQSIQSILIEKCCQVGKERAMESARFDCKLSAREAIISSSSSGSATRNNLLVMSAKQLLNNEPTFADQCEMVLESCCMAHHRTRNCNSGKQYARLGAACMDVELSKEATVATESFNDCCMSCSLGILAAKNPSANETGPLASKTAADLNKRCKLISPLASSLSGQLYEQTYADCCQENLPKPSSALLLTPGAPIDCSQANPCSQRCSSRTEMRRGVQVQEGKCECFSGYRLAPDGITCLDIDECKTNTHTCDRENEVCDNVRGSFRCLARRVSLSLSASSPNEEADAYSFSSSRLCPTGFSWSESENSCQQLDNAQPRIHSSSSSSSSSSSFSRSRTFRRNHQHS